MLSALRLKHNLYLREKRIQIHSLVIRLRRENNLIYPTLRKWIRKRHRWFLRRLCPWCYSSVFICDVASEELVGAVFGFDEEGCLDVWGWSAIGCVKDMTSYSVSWGCLQVNWNPFIRCTWAMMFFNRESAVSRLLFLMKRPDFDDR